MVTNLQIKKLINKLWGGRTKL